MKSYLIQRAKMRLYSLENGKYIKNQFEDINKMLDFDYMGSAEFEFGALPQSYKRIRFNFGKYQIFDTRIKNKNGVPCFVLCNKNQKNEIIYNIKELAEDKIRLKEWITFKHHIVKSEYQWNKPDENFWWDISNDFIFWFGEDKNNTVLEIIKKDTEEFLNTLKRYKVKYTNRDEEEIVIAEEINNKLRIYSDDGTTRELNKGWIEFEEICA